MTADAGPGRNTSPCVRHVTIEEEDAGQRIDNFLIRQLKGLPRSRIYRILRRGEVRVNKGRVRPSYRLVAGDYVRIPPVREAQRTRPQPSSDLLQRLEAQVVFEDSHLLVMDKPAGLAVHGGSGVSLGLIEACRAARPDCRRLELVHRLDRETSGLVMLAKRRSSFRMLHELLRTGGVDQRYLALVRGCWPTGWKTIQAPLKKNVLRSGERVVTVDQTGRDAVTEFCRLELFADASFVEAKLVTGRTHQIRVHAAQAGYPLAGDSKYGDREFNQVLRKLGLTRLFLHATRLAYTDLETGERIEFSAPLADDLRAVLNRLEEDGLSRGRAG